MNEMHIVNIEATSDGALPWFSLIYRAIWTMHNSDHIFYYFSVNFIAWELRYFALYSTVLMLPRLLLNFHIFISFLYKK